MSFALLLNPSTIPAEMVPRARNQLRISFSCFLKDRVIFFIGSIRERMTRPHHSRRNFLAVQGLMYVQKRWKSSR